MSRLFIIVLSVCLVNLGISQQLLFEDFNSTGGVLPVGWQSIDNDAPASNSGLGSPNWDMWHVEESKYKSDSVIAASSWLEVTTVPADDWLITPAISGIQTTATLNWKAASRLASYIEPYEVYVSTGNTIADFLATTPVYTTIGEPPAFISRSVSLAAYAGQTIYIAYRITGQDEYIIEVDDIEVTNIILQPSLPPPNDECANSIDLSTSVGAGLNVPMTTGPYDNTSALPHPTDPTTGYSCWNDRDSMGLDDPKLDNTMWYTFVGDGNTYEIVSTNCGGISTPLMISGIGDGPLTAGQPKFIELYAADSIADLGIYGLESVNDGSGIGIPEFTFPAGVAVPKGTYIYITGDANAFSSFFGFNADYVDGPSTNISGDDAIALFKNGVVIDLAGDPDADGTGTPWEYQDGWMYRVSGRSASAIFNVGDWVYSGINAFDGQTTNATSPIPFLNGTFTGGTINYVPFGDTQFALYTGTCGTLTPVECKDDYPSGIPGEYPGGFILPTMAGVTYYLMVDGWSDASTGRLATGEYCMQFTEETMACNAGSVVDTGPFSVCPGDSATIEIIGDTIPTIPFQGTYGWVFSDSQGGTGGIAGGFYINTPQSNIDTYTFDSDLNGVLSNAGYPPLDGAWVVYGATFSSSINMCDQTMDSVVIYFNTGVTATVIDVSCHGDASGSIELSASCGQLPFTYLWSNGATTQDLTGVIAGTYSCVVTDGDGDVITFSKTIVEPSQLIGSASITNETGSSANGAIDFTLMGGTPPYSFLWSNGAVTEDISNLSSNNYTVDISDSNNCTMTFGPYFVDNTLSNAAIERQPEIVVLPNPTHSNVMINVALDRQMEVELELYSVTGKLMQSFELETMTSRQYYVDLSNYTSGVYLAKFRIDNQIITRRIFLMK